MKFTHAILYVADVGASLTFYEKAFRMKRKFFHEDGTYGELDTGTTALSFASTIIAETAFPSGFIKHSARAIPQAIEIALETPDVDAAFLHAVAHGAVPCTEPTDMPWGQRISRVRDCDGIVVEICSPMAVE